MTQKLNELNNIRPAEAGNTARVFVTGDVCLRGLGEQLVLDGKSASILAPMKDVLAKADLSIMQFETVLTTADTPIIKSGPNLKSDPKTLDFFKEWNGDLCLLANNHTGDFGPEPLLETIDTLHDAGFETVGAGKNLADAYKPAILTRNGLKIGVYNICENEFGGALHDTAGSAPLNVALNISHIIKLRKEADVVLVIVHGGNEYKPFPSPRVMDMSRAFADAGADAVVNIHTHCPQGVEVWNGTPIIYSLGNFYFPWRLDDTKTYKPENFWFTGYCVAFNVDAKGCFSFELVPTHFTPDATSIAPLEGEEKEGFFDYLNQISAPVADEDLIRRVHECWSAMSNYISVITKAWWKEDIFTIDEPAHKARVMNLRNLNTCEAHHEILKTYFRLYEQGRLQEALQLKDYILGFQKATFMKH